MAHISHKKKWKGKYEGPSMEERVQELVSILDDGVKNFSYSPEEYKAVLQMKALMPNYSFRNLMVARAQKPHMSFIASFVRWKELGRNVKKGERAIKIFAPRIVNKMDTETGIEKPELIGFITVPVFDVSQTEGDPLPIDLLKIELEGDCPEAHQIIRMAEKMAKNDGCPITYGDAGSANGFYRITDHSIVVSDKLSVNHRCKTLIHELVHSKVHRYSKASSSEKEVVAEGTAFVVCSYFGLDTSDYSFRYVKGWSQGDEESLMKYGTQISEIAGQIILEFQELEAMQKQDFTVLSA